MPEWGGEEDRLFSSNLWTSSELSYIFAWLSVASRCRSTNTICSPRFFRACAESLAGENASRLATLQRAENNIDELLEDRNSHIHQLRQSGIDEELFDVISGFEALGKG